jgi:uncharacterized repeat protein (TIGR01451 family)
MNIPKSFGRFIFIPLQAALVFVWIWAFPTLLPRVDTLARAASDGLIIQYVKPGGVNFGACNSWGTACDLQYALTTAISGTEIWIASGIYTPGVSPTSNFTLKSGVALYGGFAMTETTRDQRSWKSNLTVLSGDIDGNDTTEANGVVTDTANIHGANAYHVLVANGTDATAVLDGLIVTAGNANGDGVNDPTYNGGGLYSSLGSPIVQNVTFSGNQAWGDGGGWYAYSGSPTLNHVFFTKNKSRNLGGGLSVRGDSNITLNEVTFIDNQSVYGGGMASNASGHISLTNVAFLGNSATSGCCYTSGGGLWLESINASATLNNLLFSGNSSDWYGGGMYIAGEAVMTNFTFSGNRAGDSGGALYLYNGQHALVNFIVWGNSSSGSQIYNGGGSGSPLSITYSDVQGGGAGTGNLNADPQFVAPISYTAAPTTAGNYRLQITSPVIDAGSSLSVTVATDLDNHPRKIDVPAALDTGAGAPPIVDMGAYEASWPAAIVGTNQSVKSGDLVTLDGSGSTDPSGNLPLTYDWEQTGGAPVVLSSSLISRPTFTAPMIANQTVLTFTLVVTNSIEQVSAPAVVTVTVNPIVVDLSLSLTDGKTFAISGDPITYTLVVSNAGPDTAIGAVITNTLPAEKVTGITWACVASTGSNCPASGSGLFNTIVDIQASGTVTFTIRGEVAPEAKGMLLHSALVVHSSDPNLSNNQALDSDILLHTKINLPLIDRP